MLHFDASHLHSCVHHELKKKLVLAGDERQPAKRRDTVRRRQNENSETDRNSGLVDRDANDELMGQ
jgi:hypothetical protein